MAERGPLLASEIVMRLLCVADGVELVFVHGAVRVEAGALPDPDRLVLLQTPRQELAQRPRFAVLPILVDALSQCADLGEGLLGLVFVGAGLAVGLEAAALVEVEEGAAELVGAEGAVEGGGAELVGVAVGQFLALGVVLRHQAVVDENCHEIGAALQVTVPAAALAACYAAFHRERCLALRLASIGKDAGAHTEHTVGFAALVDANCSPADGVGAKIEAESVTPAVSIGHRAPCCFERQTGGKLAELRNSQGVETAL